MKLQLMVAIAVSGLMGPVEGLVFAQDRTENRGPDTVVTVTTRPNSVSTTAADIDVVDGESARSAGKGSLADTLRNEPALYVGQTGQRGGLTVISLRGGDPNFTLLLIDGVPVNDTTDELGGTADLGTVLPFNISRVEVLRGPISAIHGSEAMGGVVNVITSDESSRRWNGQIVAGSFGTSEARLVTSARHGRFRYNAGIAGLRIGEQVERDFFRLIDSGGRGTVDFNGQTSLTFTARVRGSKTSRFPANSGGPRFALNRDLEEITGTAGSGGLELGRNTAQWSHLLGLDFFRQDESQHTPAIFDRNPPSFRTVPETLSDTTFDRWRVKASSSRRSARGWVGTVGFEYRRENGLNEGRITGLGPTPYRLERHTVAEFGEIVFNRPGWSVVSGFRFDWISGYRRVSPRIGLSHVLPWKGARARGSWGLGFKMPSFYAVAQPFIGNRDLKPETNNAVDAGIEQSAGRFGTISFNLFQSIYGDLVDFSPELFRLVNRSKAVARGSDVSWRFVSKIVTARVHATYTRSRLEETSEPLRDRPRWRLGANLTIPIRRRTTVFADSLWVGRRHDFQVPVPLLETAPSYFVANIAFRHTFGERISAFVRADNVLNRHYQEYVGFPNPGRNLRVGLDLSSN